MSSAGPLAAAAPPPEVASPSSTAGAGGAVAGSDAAPPVTDAVPPNPDVDTVDADDGASPLPVTPYRAFAVRSAKLVHFIRHCEATHNVAAAAEGRGVYTREEFLDAPLTEKGREQAESLRDVVTSTKAAYDVVLVSPLARSLATAEIAFPGADMVAVEELRERMGVNVCDRRRPLKEIVVEFPKVDFSTIDSEDTLWKAEHREGKEELVTRAIRAVEIIMARPERNIAVVTHSSFLLHLLSFSGITADEELSKWFENGEMRSMFIV